MKEFTVITDEDIRDLEVGAEYKSNGSFFEVTEITSKGADGGTFIVKRTGGKNDPGRKWTRVLGKGPVDIRSRETLLQWFFEGGGGAVGAVIMGTIAGLLLVLIIIAINSLFVYRGGRQAPPRFLAAAREAIAQRDLDGFTQLSLGQKGLLGGVCRAMLADFQTTTSEDMRTLAETETQRQVTILRVPLRALNLISVIAPLLGLFGTVWGLMVCFESVAEEAASAGKSQAMAEGIRIALRTTFAGLAVAVVALVVFFIFNQKLNMIVGRVRGMATEVAHKLTAIKPGAKPSGSRRRSRRSPKRRGGSARDEGADRSSADEAPAVEAQP
jgi:biopolymer transport protein ExbB